MMNPNQAVFNFLDEQIREIQELKRMSANPRLVDLMRQIVQQSDRAMAPAPNRYQNGHALEEMTPQHVAASQSKPNGLTAATVEAVHAMGRPFTLADIVDSLNNSGFQFASAKPKVAVAAPMKALLKRKKVRLVKAGMGNDPHVYEFIEGTMQVQ